MCSFSLKDVGLLFLHKKKKENPISTSSSSKSASHLKEKCFSPPHREVCFQMFSAFVTFVFTQGVLWQLLL